MPVSETGARVAGASAYRFAGHGIAILAAAALSSGCGPEGAPRTPGTGEATAGATDMAVRIREFESGRGPAPIAEAVQLGRAGFPWLALILTGPETLAAMKASDAFVAAGADAVPTLLRVLDSGCARGRNWAAHALGRLGRAAAPALEALRKAESEPALKQVSIEARQRIEGGRP